MSYYLFLDGTDDYLTFSSLTVDRIELDLRFLANGWAWEILDSNTDFELMWKNEHGDGEHTLYVQDATSLSINGVSSPLSENFIDIGTRVTLAIDISSRTANFTLGRHLWQNYYANLEVYNVKFYNNSTLVAHYDMNTGTVNDISGNGNHATLIGGTWIDEGQGGGTEPEPTPIQIDFSTKQSIYRQSIEQINTKQTVYKSIIESLNTKYSIYKQLSEQFNTNQSIYKPTTTDFPTSQIITAITGYAVDFSTRQIIYKSTFESVSTKQSVFKPVTSDYLSNQLMYISDQQYFKTKQSIFKQIISDFATKQIINKWENSDFRTKQNIFKQDVSNVSTIQVIFKQSTSGYTTSQNIFIPSVHTTSTKQIIYKQTNQDAPIDLNIFKSLSEDFPILVRFYSQDQNFQKRIEMEFYITREVELTFTI